MSAAEILIVISICHPERSMSTRAARGHAESKDPYEFCK